MQNSLQSETYRVLFALGLCIVLYLVAPLVPTISDGNSLSSVDGGIGPAALGPDVLFSAQTVRTYDPRANIPTWTA